MGCLSATINVLNPTIEVIVSSLCKDTIKVKVSSLCKVTIKARISLLCFIGDQNYEPFEVIEGRYLLYNEEVFMVLKKSKL
jgi:hypothetical protein